MTYVMDHGAAHMFNSVYDNQSPSSPAVGFLWFRQRVVKERVALVCVLLHLKTLLLARHGGVAVAPGRLTVPRHQMTLTFTL